jgi:two-component system OmpR family sensor kinase
MRLPARSIRRDLVTWLAAWLLAAIAIAAIATYLRARDEANALFDYQLQQMAASITGMPLAGPSLDGTPGANALVVQVWDRNGVQVFLSQPQASLPRHAQLGYNTVSTGAGEWRVFSTLAGGQVVQVAQPLSVRRELAASMALRTIVPLLALVPPAGGAGVVRHRARPAATAARSRRREQRSPRAPDRSPKPACRSRFARWCALNGLLERLDRAGFTTRFHRRRGARCTPLTAVRRPSWRAGAVDASVRAHWPTCAPGWAATISSTIADARPRRAGVRAIVRAGQRPARHHVIAEHAAVAAARGVDLGTGDADASATDVIVNGDSAGLRAMLSNLVDNAVRYAPDDGRVDVAVRREPDAVTLQVRDNGPGIPPAERARVFDRFYRVRRPGAADVPGSGLGLAIAKRIAERHDAEITLAPGIAGPLGEGLTVSVRFPADFATATAA